jgi:hypothetical protein
LTSQPTGLIVQLGRLGVIMKIRIIAALVMVGSLSAPAWALSSDEACKEMAGAAEAVMRARQNGVAMQKLLDVASNPKFASGQAGFRAIIMMAYDKPRFNTEENKQHAVDDFRDAVQLYCMKSLEPK